MSHRLFDKAHYHAAWVPEVRLDALQRASLARLRLALEKGEISLEEVPCYFCGTDEHDVVATRDRYGLPVSTALCVRCGGVYRRRRLAEASAGAFYAGFYDGLFKGRVGTQQYFQFQTTHGRVIAAYLARYLARVKSIAEFGAGPGGISSHLADRGYACRAFDLNDGYADVSFHRSVTTRPGGISAALLRDDLPDLVILSHVLEHTFDPFTALAECWKSLPPGGLLYVEVPGLHGYGSGHHQMCGCPERHPYQRDLIRGVVIAHNFEFDRHLLGLLVTAAGFEVLESDDLVRMVARKIGSPRATKGDLGQVRQGWYKRNRDYLVELETDRVRWVPLYRAAHVMSLPVRTARRAARLVLDVLR